MDQQNKVCLITGSNDGIGKETAIELAEKGMTIVMLCRNQEKSEQARDEIAKASGNPNVTLFIADLGSQKQIREVVPKIMQKYDRIHILINNAGVFLNDFHTVESGAEATIGINHFGHFLLTHLLLDTLTASAPSRIINVSSMAHQGVYDVDFNALNHPQKYSGYHSYCLSKLFNLLFTYELAEHLDPSQVTVNALHPGVINTKLLRVGWGGVGSANVKKGAETSIYIASASNVEGITGAYFSDQKQVKSSPLSYDPAVRKNLWEISLKDTGIGDYFNRR